jgi:hypothetical protein
MKGAIRMGGNVVTNLKHPSDNTDAATKEYVDKTAAPAGFGGYGEAVATVGTFATEATLEAALNGVFGTMKNNETRRIRFVLQTLGNWTWTGIFFRSSDNYAILEVSSGVGIHVSNLTKTLSGGTWTPVEWLNPPMIKGVRYRTMERYASGSVYVELGTDGKVRKFLEDGTDITARYNVSIQIVSSVDEIPADAPEGALFVVLT